MLMNKPWSLASKNWQTGQETKQLHVLEDENLDSRDFPGEPVVGSPGRLPLQVLQVWFLEEELGSFMTHSEAKKKKKKFSIATINAKGIQRKQASMAREIKEDRELHDVLTPGAKHCLSMRSILWFSSAFPATQEWLPLKASRVSAVWEENYRYHSSDEFISTRLQGIPTFQHQAYSHANVWLQFSFVYF